MKDTKRALRRHHRRRMIARALRSFRNYSRDPEERLDWARRNYNNLQVCSCYMCGHRRKWWGPTMQERRQQQRERIPSRDDETNPFPDETFSAE